MSTLLGFADLLDRKYRYKSAAIHIFSIVRLTSISYSGQNKHPQQRLNQRRNAWRTWEDNIIMDLEEIGINTGNLVDSAQDRHYWRAL